MGATDRKRQIKQTLITKALKEADYSVIQWYIDSSNTVRAFQVRNTLNNIDFLAFTPSNIIMASEIGVYLSKTTSPDMDRAVSMWNDLAHDSLAIIVDNGLILRTDKTIECFTITPDKRLVNCLDDIAGEFDGLEETNIVVPAGQLDSGIKIVGQINPFDRILDGDDYVPPEGTNTRLEDCQPSILVNYRGFTNGQAVPLVSIVQLMNGLAGFEKQLAKQSAEITAFQIIKVKTNGEEAVLLLTTFLDTLKKTLKGFDDDVKSWAELQGKVQSLLEKASGSKTGAEVYKKAHSTLQATNEQFIGRRDNLLALLGTCKELFHQV